MSVLLRRIDFYLRFARSVAGFGAAVLYGAWLQIARRDGTDVGREVGRAMCRWVTGPARITVRVSGEERLHRHRPCVVVGNHQSQIDYPIYGGLFTPNSVVLGKVVGKWNLPVVGWLFRATGNVTVDPRTPWTAGRAFRDARRAMEERDVNVWLAPEGTRAEDPLELGRFNRGAFLLAVETGAPIVPMVLSPLKPRTDLPGRRLEPNELELRVLEPVPTDGLSRSDVDDLLHRVRGRMQAELYRMAGVTPGSEAGAGPAAAPGSP